MVISLGGIAPEGSLYRLTQWELTFGQKEDGLYKYIYMYMYFYI